MPLVSRSRPRSSMISNSFVFAPSSCQLAGAVLHRTAPRVGLHAPAAPTGTAPAAVLDHHVADLPGRPAPGPPLAVEDQPAADAGAPEDAEDRVVGLAGAELELGVRSRRRRRCRSAPGRRARRRASGPAGRCPPSPGGCGPRRRPRSPRSCRPASRRRRRSANRSRTPAASAASTSALAISSATSAGPPSVGVWRRASPLTSPVGLTIAAWILVPPRSMPPRSASLPAAACIARESIPGVRRSASARARAAAVPAPRSPHAAGAERRAHDWTDGWSGWARRSSAPHAGESNRRAAGVRANSQRRFPSRASE